MNGLTTLKATDGIFSSSQRTPHKVAIRCGDRSVSYSELIEKVKRIQYYCVNKLNLKVGDKVSLLGPNCIEYLELLIALIDIGVGVVTINPKSSQDEIDQIEANLVTSVKFKIAGGAIIKFTDTRSNESTVDLIVPEQLFADSVTFDWNLPAIITFSSGTTGKAKPIFISHKARVMTSITMPYDWNWHGDDVFLALPSFATGGGSGATLAALYIGAEVVIAEQYSSDYLVDIINKNKVNTMLTVPAITHQLVGKTFNHKLKSIVSTAAMFPPDLKVTSSQKWPDSLYEVYATTETGPISILTPLDLNNKLFSVGRACTGSNIKIVDEFDNNLPPGVQGEIVVRTLTQVYDGWQRTNDIGYIDEDNYLYIVGRADDMIVTRGFNIHPKEIEDVINQYPGVAESCVVGKQDGRWGELPIAFIVGNVEIKQLKVFCKSKLSAYKVPRKFIQIDSIPKNILGKVERKKLRELL